MVADEFAQRVVAAIPEYLPEEYRGAVVYTENVLKDGDRTLTGLCIRMPEEQEFPRIYLEGYEQEFRRGASLSGILRAIAEQYENGRHWEDPSRRARYVTADPDLARQLVTYRILNHSRNIQNITNRPSRVQGEFVYVYSVEVGNGARIPVDHRLADRLGLTEPELFRLASQNSPVLTPAEVLTVGEALGREGPHAEDMLVISNTEHADGAVAVLYPGVDDEIRRRLGGDYYVLPSSVHEVLAVPKEPESLESLETMVQQINHSRIILSPADFLADHVFEVKDGALTRALPEKTAERTAPPRRAPEPER